MESILRFDPLDRFMCACELGDVSEVCRSLETERIPKHSIIVRAIEKVCAHGHLSVARILIEKFSHIIQQTDFERFLAQALSCRNEEVARYLWPFCEEHVPNCPSAVELFDDHLGTFGPKKDLIMFFRLCIEFGWPLSGIPECDLALLELDDMKESWTDDDLAVIDALLEAKPDLHIMNLLSNSGSKDLRLWKRWRAVHGADPSDIASHLEFVRGVTPEKEELLRYMWSTVGIRVTDLTCFADVDGQSAKISKWLHAIELNHWRPIGPDYIPEYIRYVSCFLQLERIDNNVAERLWALELSKVQKTAVDSVSVLILHCLHQFYVSRPTSVPRPSWLPSKVHDVLDGVAYVFAACLVLDWTAIERGIILFSNDCILGAKLLIAGYLTASPRREESLRNHLVKYFRRMYYKFFCEAFMANEVLSTMIELTSDCAVIDAVLDVALSEPYTSRLRRFCVHLLFMAHLDGDWQEHATLSLLQRNVDVIPKTMTVDQFVSHFTEMIHQSERLRIKGGTRRKSSLWQRHFHNLLTAGEVWFGPVFIEKVHTLLLAHNARLLGHLLCYSPDGTLVREQYRRGYFLPQVIPPVDDARVVQSIWRHMLECNRLDTVRWLMDEIGVLPQPRWFYDKEGDDRRVCNLDVFFAEDRQAVMQFFREKWTVTDFLTPSSM